MSLRLSFFLRALIFLFWGCGAAFAAQAGPWTQEVYVWQRQEGPEVLAALRATAPDISGACVLAAEVSWREGQLKVARPRLDCDVLQRLGKPIGLALRIGPFNGPFAEDDSTATQLSTLVADLLARAAAGGLQVKELQIDFDCAEAKLAGYRRWLLALRKGSGATPLVITVLPSWLKADGFRDLVQTTDGFVLQVHSLEKPASPNAPFTLCDPERAQAWVRQASALGVPFRVALPTYGYRLAFTTEGKFFALSAEGPRPACPAGTQVRIVRSDAVAMAGLVQRLAAEKPAGCTGVIWFRLPVPGDELNWDARTLSAVLHQETPTSHLALEVTSDGTGLVEVRLVNHGQLSEPLPATLHIRWTNSVLALAADGLGGYAPVSALGASQPALTLNLAAASRERVLAPDRSRPVAWIRFPHELSLDLHLFLSP